MHIEKLKDADRAILLSEEFIEYFRLRCINRLRGRLSLELADAEIISAYNDFIDKKEPVL